MIKVHDYVEKILKFKTYDEIKGFKIPKYSEIIKSDLNIMEAKSREMATFWILSLYLFFRKIKLWVKSFAK